MKPIRMYLDEAEDRGIVKNDSDLSRRLGVSRACVSDWRRGNAAPNEDQAAQLAELLGKPEVMPECAAHRAKTPGARAAWERLAKMASMTTAYGALVVANLLFAPSPAEAAPDMGLSAMTIGIMSTWLACLSRRWRRRPGREAVAIDAVPVPI